VNAILTYEGVSKSFRIES